MFDTFFVQQVVNGLSIGLVYALIAIGFTLIFGVLNVVNFAHGEVYTIGAFAGLLLITALAPPLLAVCWRCLPSAPSPAWLSSASPSGRSAASATKPR